MKIDDWAKSHTGGNLSRMARLFNVERQHINNAKRGFATVQRDSSGKWAIQYPAKVMATTDYKGE